MGQSAEMTGPWDPQPGPGEEEGRERIEIRKQGTGKAATRGHGAC